MAETPDQPTSPFTNPAVIARTAAVLRRGRTRRLSLEQTQANDPEDVTTGRDQHGPTGATPGPQNGDHGGPQQRAGGSDAS